MLVLLAACRPLVGTLEQTDVYAEPLDTTYVVGAYVRPDAPRGPGAPWALLLDGDVHLETAARQLDAAVRRGEADPIVIVGVGNQDTRERDYTTPFEVDVMPTDDWTEWAGGVDPFFGWVEGELVPEREAALDVGGAPEDRGVVGHSYGGLATVWLLLHHGDRWGRFGAVSPSSWWDQGAPFTWEEQASTVAGRAHFSIGSVEGPPMNSLFDALVDRLDAHEPLDLTSRVFEGHDHRSVLNKAFGDAFSELYPP
jgi:predicted alpha/beta superfamily hydrolase